MRRWGGKSILGDINCHGLRWLHAAAPTTTVPMAITYVATAAMQRVNADPIPVWCSSGGFAYAGTGADSRCIRDLAASGHAWSRTQAMPKERRLQKHQSWPSTGHQHLWGSNNPSTPTAYLRAGSLPKPITDSTYASLLLPECRLHPACTFLSALRGIFPPGLPQFFPPMVPSPMFSPTGAEFCNTVLISAEPKESSKQDSGGRAQERKTVFLHTPWIAPLTKCMIVHKQRLN